MYYVELKRIRFIFLVVTILLLTFTFSGVKAENELVFLDEDEEVSGEYYYEDEYDSSAQRPYGRKSRTRIVERRPNNQYRDLALSDEVFVQQDRNATFVSLLTKVTFIIALLIIALFLVKVFFSRERFGKPGSFFNDVAQKFASNFSNPQGLKLKQTLMLTPGQNLYVIEIEDKKLLIGGTQQGGVQFLADLTDSIETNELGVKELEASLLEMQDLNLQTKSPKGDNPFAQPNISANINEQTETRPKVMSGSQPNGKAFKRRTNFRQTLFNNGKRTTNPEELVLVQR